MLRHPFYKRDQPQDSIVKFTRSTGREVERVA